MSGSSVAAVPKTLRSVTVAVPVSRVAWEQPGSRERLRARARAALNRRLTEQGLVHAEEPVEKLESKLGDMLIVLTVRGQAAD